MRTTMLAVTGVVLLAMFTVDSAKATWPDKPCDFVTGGGYIIRPNGAKANFGVGGGCKHGSPTWGHLNYVDHGNAPGQAPVPPPFHVHATSITAYLYIDDRDPDPKNRQPRGTRQVCGRAKTNHPLYPEVDFRLQVSDFGEPGNEDEFIIRLGVNGTIIYTTEFDWPRTLGGYEPGGGNIQLHKPNPSTTGNFGGECRI